MVTNERYEPEQVLSLTSSQLVHEREMAKAVTAWLLPLQNPRLKKEEQGEEPYPWADAAEVSEAVLKQATRLDLAPVPAEQEHTQTHAFKMRADVGRAIYLRVDPKLKSFGGYLMREAAPFDHHRAALPGRVAHPEPGRAAGDERRKDRRAGA